MKKLNNIFVFIAAFFLGICLCLLFFKFQERKNNEKAVLSLLKEENNSLSWLAEVYLRESIKRSADTTMREILFLKDMKLMSNYFNTILSSKEYDSFSVDTVKSILNNSIRLNDLYEKIKQISFQNNTPIESEFYLNLYFNIILNNCFELYKRDALIAGEWECVFVPKKNTVKKGDYYEAQIYFTVKDITKTYTIADTADFNKIISVGDIYKEKATTKGVNTREVNLLFFNGIGTIGFPVEFSFYVE